MKLKLCAAAAVLSVAATSTFAIDVPVTLIDGSGSFGATRTARTFTDNFTFSVLTASTVSASIVSDLGFSSVTLTGGPGFETTFANFGIYSFLGNEVSRLKTSPVLAAGTYAISINVGMGGTPGLEGDARSFAGILTVSPIPEPGTYALLLAGLVGVGVGVRRHRKEGN